MAHQTWLEHLQLTVSKANKQHKQKQRQCSIIRTRECDSANMKVQEFKTEHKNQVSNKVIKTHQGFHWIQVSRMQHGRACIPSRDKTWLKIFCKGKKFCTLFNLRRYQFLTACLYEMTLLYIKA